MTTATMRAIYLALSSGMAIPVTRAWPQHDAAMPSCAFRLLSWQLQADGSTLASFLLLLRVNSPADGDTYSAQAVTAMSTLGYTLHLAADSVEPETGFFLRELTFAAALNVPPAPLPAPEVTYPLAVRFYDAATAQYFYLPAPVSFAFTPARRAYIDSRTISADSNNFPEVKVGVFEPSTVTFSCPYTPDFPVYTLLKNAFHAGTQLSFLIRYRYAHEFRAYGVITAYHASALGVVVSITTRYEFFLA